ncbi:MFS general substrate transporter [Piromyces finnis]|uniref:MFS general substrate transporter n=1 Tax=Piromyces finnis TaxID=1754191 RepID=A0A1Y1UTH6_9FUNG|nr:MFS general substrate transporter [Piromyces finnis]|eukprot:ORX41323.1 MFS general substrate transporter [Piromyces finnis]
MDNLVIHKGKKVSDKRRSLMFLNINISCIATSMLATALTTALPPIMEDFNIDVNSVQWITSGFALFLAIVMPLTAYLITRFRTKRLYCIALSFFILGLTVCAVSPNLWVMMLGRVIQGCGSGLISSMTQVIILTIYPPEKRGTIMGWYGLSIGVAPIIAPTLAGVLVDYVGWRMIFVISIIIMLFSLVFALCVFEDVLPTMKKKFDIISLLISAIAFGGITLAAGNMGKYQFVSVQVLLLLVIGIIFTTIFIIRQLRLKVPFLDVRVLKDSKLSNSIISTIILQITLLGSAIVFPLYVQQIKGESATLSGLVILPGSLVMALISPFAGKLYDKIGMKILFIVESVILIFSNLALFFITIKSSIWLVSVIHVFRCFAIGGLLMPLVTWGMTDIPKTKASDATALLNSVRSIGGAIGSALFVSIMTTVSNSVKGKKENPDMFGFNVVFLTMTGLAIILSLLGIFGCKKETKKSTISSEKSIIENKSLDESEKIEESQKKEVGDNTEEILKKEVEMNNNNKDINIVVKEE